MGAVDEDQDQIRSTSTSRTREGQAKHEGRASAQHKDIKHTRGGARREQPRNPCGGEVPSPPVL